MEIRPVILQPSCRHEFVEKERSQVLRQISQEEALYSCRSEASKILHGFLLSYWAAEAQISLAASELNRRMLENILVKRLQSAVKIDSETKE